LNGELKGFQVENKSETQREFGKKNIGEEEMLKRATGNPAVFDHDPSLE